MPKGSEIEVKFEADRVGFIDFYTWARRTGSLDLTRWRPVIGTDCFWTHPGGGVPVRHRHDDGSGNDELTVKARKSQSSTLNRHEINLALLHNDCQGDIEALLSLAGFTKGLRLTKHSDIAHGAYRGHQFCFALYDAWIADRPDTVKRFLEIELEGDGDEAGGTEALHELVLLATATTGLGLGEPVNYSLYEYFSKVAAGEVR